MSKVWNVYESIEKLAPFGLACAFDNPGLLVGDGQAEVTGCLLALDVTPRVLREAVAQKANLIVTHHPVIFDPLRHLTAGHPVYQLIQNNLSVISAHTNLDIVGGGVNDCLAGCLALSQTRPFGEEAMGRVGLLPQTMTAEAFAAYVKEKLGCRAVRYTPSQKPIGRVALCGGSGGSLLKEAMEQADALVTGDVKHDVFMDAVWNDFCLIDAGHYKTEAVVLEALRGHIQRSCPDISVWVSKDMKEEVHYL